MDIKDQAARKQALDLRYSFIVQAPAGSGKTTLLTHRLLALLSQVEKPEECLAITFTRKAAGEMRDRILSALTLAEQEAPAEDSHDYQTWVLAKAVLEQNSTKDWDLIHNPTRLKILTVDALCAGLARQMPLSSQFGALPKVSEEPNRLYREAARNLILSTITENSEEALFLQNLILHLDNNIWFAERLLGEFLSIREQWLPYVTLANDAPEKNNDKRNDQTKNVKVRKLLEQGLKEATLKELTHCLENKPKDLVLWKEILELACYAASRLIEEKIDSSITGCFQWSSKTNWFEEADTDSQKENRKGVFDIDIIQTLPQWLGLAELLLTEKNEWRKMITAQQGFQAPSQLKNKEQKAHAKFMKDRMQALLETLSNESSSDIVNPKHHFNQDLFKESLAKVRICPPLQYTEETWKAVEGIIQALPKLAAHLTLVFQQYGEVDFSEISMAAQRALQENEHPTELALALDYKLKHILVDEFQDISIPQNRLLEQLTLGWQTGDGRTLFLVGDPQQSIYRFRQAEVGLFLKAKQQGLGSISLIPLTLSVNFRSSTGIIDWINITFKEKFPKQDDVSFGSVAFCPSVGIYEPMDSISPVTLHSVDKDNEGEKLIHCIEESRSQDPKGSIALLVRSRSHLAELLPLLKKRNISYQGVDIESFMSHPLAQDLVSFTKALLHIGDRIAWLSLLRMPNLSLSLQDIHLLANYEPKLPLWFSLKAHKNIAGISLEGQSCLAQLVSTLEEIFNEQHSYPLSRWIQKAWKKIQPYEVWFSNEQDLIFTHFFNFLEQQGYSDEFYDVLKLEKSCSLFYVPTENKTDNPIHIMTIHKAKGLEFDTVIVAGIERRRKADSEKLLLWEQDLSLAGKPYLIFAPIRDRSVSQDPIYRYLKTLNNKRSQFEEMRLMYVASTRAKKRLYWLSHEKIQENN